MVAWKEKPVPITSLEQLPLSAPGCVVADLRWLLHPGDEGRAGALIVGRLVSHFTCRLVKVDRVFENCRALRSAGPGRRLSDGYKK